MKIKSIIILLLIAVVAQTASAQRRLKYKDVYDDMPNVRPEISYMRYNELRQQDPEFVNTYFQMGLINWAWLQAEDPFVNTQKVMQLIYDTKLYLGVFKGYLDRDDKEVKKNKAFYMNYNIIPNMEQLDYQDVVNYITKTINKVKEYETNVTRILNFYTKTVEKNNDCVELFKSIVATQNNYKNLLMTADRKIKKQLVELTNDYDSLTYYFNEFKTALANYPIKDYNQQLEVIPISTYRLDGLTPSDFLQPKIPIWDYRSWVLEVSGIMDGNVTNVKQQSIAYVNDLRAKIAKYQQDNNFTDVVPEFKSNNRLVNLTEKYDYKSLMSACVNYETALANLKLVTLKSNNSTSDTSALAEPYSRKALYYYDLYLHKNKCDNQLDIVKERTTNRSCNKHKVFIDTLYNSTNAFNNSFESTQRNNLKQIENQYLANMQTFAKNEFDPENIQLQWQKANISLSIYTGTFEEAQVGNYYTLCNVRDAFGNRYSCGFRKATSNTATGFVMKSSLDGKVLWLKSITNSPSGKNFVVNIIPSETNAYVITTLSVDASGNKTQTAKFDDSGKLTAKVDFKSPLVPVVADYDDLNEQVTVVFKGTTLNVATQAEDAAIEVANFAAKTSTPKANFNLDGNVSGVTIASGKIVAICNYKTLTSTTYKIDLKSQGDIALLIVDDNVSASPLNSKSPIYSVYPAKTNAQTICIPAIEGQFKNKVSSNDKLVYNIANIDGKFIYSSNK